MILKETEDRFGNKLYEKDKSIYLYLKENQQTRKLWAISPKWELFIRRFNKHIFRKFNAYWFNYNLLKQLSPDMKVIVKEEDWTILETTVQEILTKWIARQYVQEWFELQIFFQRNLFHKN